MCDLNLFDTVPKDIIDLIAEWYDDGCIVMMSFVSARIGEKFSHHMRSDYNLCNYGASEGKIEIIEFAREYGFRCTTDTANYAVTNGNLPMVKYLHSISCPFDSNICTTAALNGNIG
jgi:hypothetical protein